jgi:hypothetical protein
MKWMQFYNIERTHVRISSLYQTRGVVSQFNRFAIVIFSKDYPDGQKDLWYDKKDSALRDYDRLKEKLATGSSKMFYSLNDTNLTTVNIDKVFAYTSKHDDEKNIHSLRFYEHADKYLEVFYEDGDSALCDLNGISGSLRKNGFFEHVHDN